MSSCAICHQQTDSCCANGACAGCHNKHCSKDGHSLDLEAARRLHEDYVRGMHFAHFDHRRRGGKV